MSAASGALVVLAFFGNVFMSLPGGMLDVVRYPVTEGERTTMDRTLQTDKVWMLVANVAAWALIFGAFAVLASRRATARR